MIIAAREPSGAVDSARCGAVGAGQTSWIQRKVFEPGTLSFYWKHTAGNCSMLRFTIDGESRRTCN